MPPTNSEPAPSASASKSSGCDENWMPAEWSPKQREKYVRYKELRDAPMPSAEPIFSPHHVMLPTVAIATLLMIGVLAWKKERFIQSAAAIGLLAFVPMLWGLMNSLELLLAISRVTEQTNFLPLGSEDDGDDLLFAVVEALRPARLGMIYTVPCLLLVAAVTSFRALRCGKQQAAKVRRTA